MKTFELFEAKKMYELPPELAKEFADLIRKDAKVFLNIRPVIDIDGEEVRVVKSEILGGWVDDHGVEVHPLENRINISKRTTKSVECSQSVVLKFSMSDNNQVYFNYTVTTTYRFDKKAFDSFSSSVADNFDDFYLEYKGFSVPAEMSNSDFKLSLENLFKKHYPILHNRLILKLYKHKKKSNKFFSNLHDDMEIGEDRDIYGELNKIAAQVLELGRKTVVKKLNQEQLIAHINVIKSALDKVVK